ncbi:hypothetical protein SH580_14410 [Coraliomargarita algicola]|uniref:Uncharacterized protein n=1 Tax=Coraliomargarita algicola TaxID=3092156 RepID=A0ABZ0RIK7_9BACT|nr:hypothetical protein [Coraliomargarita sp. J2-16]WPJ94625.1 hypothetical protein SH580_14410 [Coraliomargarita sp. J2-16]
MTAETPASIIFDAGTPQQTVITGTVATLPGMVADLPSRTGLVYAGTGAGYELWPDFTALSGRRIRIMDTDNVGLMRRVLDLGGAVESESAEPPHSRLGVPPLGGTVDPAAAAAEVYSIDELELFAEQQVLAAFKQELAARA